MIRKGKSELLNVLRGLALFLALVASGVSAGTISFEEIDSADGSVAQQHYAGFQWDSRWALGNSFMPGFNGITSSGVQFLYNAGLTSNLVISRADPFDLLGLYLAAPDLRSRAYWVKVTAYDSSNQMIGTTGYKTIGTSPLWVGTAFTNVSRLVIDPYGGLFSVDALQYRNTLVSLSEAGALALFAIGLLGLWAARRRTS